MTTNGLYFVSSILIAFLCGVVLAADELDTNVVTSPFNQLEGKVGLPKQARPTENWQAETRILLNYGQFVGFIGEDGSFVINDVPPGSYIVEVANKDFMFEPVRVDISSRGKIRGRKLNLLQPAAVNQIAYPLKLTARQPANYFRKREEWRVTDMLMNPMVLMMVVPFLIIMVLPKLVNTNDPEFQREMQQPLAMPKYEMPELSEMMVKIFGGAQPTKSKPKPVKPKRS